MIIFTYPLRNPRITQYFDGNWKRKVDGKEVWFYVNADGTKDKHRALDIVSKDKKTFGADLLAAHDGVVDTVRGNHTIWINHPSLGYFTQYVHCLDVIVKVGDEIKRGQVVGHVGGDPKDNIPDGGTTSGPHCHFRVATTNNSKYTAIDPLNTVGMQMMTLDEFNKLGEINELPVHDNPTPTWQEVALAWAKENKIIEKPNEAPFTPAQVAWIAEIMRKMYNKLKV